MEIRKNQFIALAVVILTILCISDLKLLAEDLVLAVLCLSLMALIVVIVCVCKLAIEGTFEKKAKDDWEKRKPPIVKQLDEAFGKVYKDGKYTEKSTKH